MKQLIWVHIVVACISLVSLIRVTITRHVFIFINIFQVEQVSAVKFDKGYEKNISFLVMPNLQKFEKKSWKIWLGSLKQEKVWNRKYVSFFFQTEILQFTNVGKFK